MSERPEEPDEDSNDSSKTVIPESPMSSLPIDDQKIMSKTADPGGFRAQVLVGKPPKPMESTPGKWAHREQLVEEMPINSLPFDMFPEAEKRKSLDDGATWKVVTTPTDGDFQIGNLWFRKSPNRESAAAPGTSLPRSQNSQIPKSMTTGTRGITANTVKSVSRPQRRYSLDEVWKPVKTPAEGDFRIGNLWFRKSKRGEPVEPTIKRSESLRHRPTHQTATTVATGTVASGSKVATPTIEPSKRRKVNLGEVWKPVKEPVRGDFQIGNLWFRKANNNNAFTIGEDTDPEDYPGLYEPEEENAPNDEIREHELYEEE